MATTRRKQRKEPPYDFTLVLGRKPRLTIKVCNILYEAGCDDASLSMCEGIGHLDFHRESDSCRSAILSAIADVEGAGIGARVQRIEPYDGQHAAIIAALNAVLELRRTVRRPTEAEELVGAMRPLWN